MRSPQPFVVNPNNCRDRSGPVRDGECRNHIRNGEYRYHARNGGCRNHIRNCEYRHHVRNGECRHHVRNCECRNHIRNCECRNHIRNCECGIMSPEDRSRPVPTDCFFDVVKINFDANRMQGQVGTCPQWRMPESGLRRTGRDLSGFINSLLFHKKQVFLQTIRFDFYDVNSGKIIQFEFEVPGISSTFLH